MPKGAHLYKHGLSGTPEHIAWLLMKARCHNKNHPRYPEWGGRGILVDPIWRKDFMAFFLYIGVGELLPESHHHHKTAWTTVATIFGMALLYVVVQIAHV